MKIVLRKMKYQILILKELMELIGLRYRLRKVLKEHKSVYN